MFMVVAIKAKKFPITAVWWVVVVVMIFVMDGQFTQVFF